VWLTAEAEGWFRHVTEATNELKRDFARMKRQKATPAEFGLRVRTHPDTLLITARNKMASGKTVVGEVRDISLAGRGIETARLYADQQRNEENLKIVDRFLSDLVDAQGMGTKDGGVILWDNVPASTVGKLLKEFLVHPLNHDFQGDAIAEFLAHAVEQGDPLLSSWTVALPTDGNQGAVEPALTSGLKVDAKKRRVLVRQTPPQSLLVSGKNARVGSSADVRYGLSDEMVKTILDIEKRPLKEIPEDTFRAAMKAPLLILYLLRGVEKEKGKKDVDFRQGLVLPALGLHFPGKKDLNAPTRYVSYRLNRVAQGEFELDGDDQGGDDDED
jgi:hypothetical protein